jgi:hypothetical protein
MDRVEQIKLEANHAKRELMKLADRLEQISPRKARSLGTIIGKLETWQNTN